MATARQRVNEACAQATNAEREAQRQTSLREQGFVSTSREESTRTEAQARRAGCEASKADVTQFQAKVNATRVEQGRTSLYAPFDGTIAKIVGEVGEYSTPSPPGVPTPPAIDPVSYTHLDVYKRQVPVCRMCIQHGSSRKTTSRSNAWPESSIAY